MQANGEFPLSSQGYGDQMLSSSLHKRVHPYPVSEPGRFSLHHCFCIKLRKILISLSPKLLEVTYSTVSNILLKNQGVQEGMKRERKVGKIEWMIGNCSKAILGLNLMMSMTLTWLCMLENFPIPVLLIQLF